MTACRPSPKFVTTTAPVLFVSKGFPATNK